MASPMSLLRSSMSALHTDAAGAYEGGHHAPIDGAGGLHSHASSSPLDVSMAGQLQDLAKQLHLQMEYNSELLSQLQRVEETHLEYQRSAQEKQGAMRQALQVADAARSEANDAKRKLAIAQEVASKTSDDLKNARVDNGILKRQLEALEKLALEAKGEIGALREERTALKSALERAGEEVRALRRDGADVRSDADERIAGLTASASALARELGELRSRQGPLLAEVEAARGNLLKLHEEAEEAKRARGEALGKVDRVQAAMASQEGALRDMKGAEARLLRSLEEEQARVAALQAAAARDAEIMSLKDAELMAAQHRCAEAAGDVAAARDAADAARREVDALAGELAAQARARGMDADHYEARLREASDDIRRIADEARAREAAHAAEMGRVTSDLADARARAEEAMNSLANDNATLHDMLTAARNEGAAAARAFDEERAAYERRVGELSHRLAVTAEAAERNDGELRSNLASVSTALAEAREEAVARNERHLAMMSALAGALRALRADAEQVRADYATLVAGARALHSHIGEALAGVQLPLTQWYEEVQRAFLYLMDAGETAKRARDDAVDASSASSVALEEARARGLMLEEALSRAEHDIASKTARLAEAQGQLEARDAAHADASRASAAIADDLRGEISRLRNALASAQRTAMGLQADASRATSDLAETQSKAAARVSALEEQVAALQSSVRALSSNCEALGEEKARALAGQEAATAVAEGTKRDARALGAALEAANEAAKSAAAGYTAQITGLSEGMKRLEAQLKQTQNLLAVVQEQRRTLTANNIALRAELDERYKATLMAAAGEAAGAVPVAPTPRAVQATPSATAAQAAAAASIAASTSALADMHSSLERMRARSSAAAAAAQPMDASSAASFMVL